MSKYFSRKRLGILAAALLILFTLGSWYVIDYSKDKEWYLAPNADHDHILWKGRCSEYQPAHCWFSIEGNAIRRRYREHESRNEVIGVGS